MFKSLFGGKKKRNASESSATDETIRSARVGDVVVISGFSKTFEDAYFIIENVHRYESSFGEWHELTGVDGDRRVGIEWSYDGEFYIAVSEQDKPMGLASIGLDDDALVRLATYQSLDTRITYEGETYGYTTSYEAYFFKDNQGEGDGFWIWEFQSEDMKKIVSVVKSGDMPFEVYTSVVVSPDLVSVYKK
ncbi:MAG: DUF4178 domain-containing protein [Chloroflexi bacterium]|nr:DUF4178 domain-containing protein [Chloroflexota bacterium]